MSVAAATATPKYDPFTIALHWLIALMVAALVVIALSVDYFPKPVRPTVVDIHGVIGATLLALVVLRILWRLTHKKPEFPETMGPLFRKAAAAGHGLLYLLMLITPIIGLVVFFLHGKALDFGLFRIPSPVAANRDLAHKIMDFHELGAYSLVALAVAHAAVAVYHQVVLRDNLLARMRPR
jgi:cytochrome b561